METNNRDSSNQDILSQNIHPLDVLLKEKRVPVLFIGAGISNRYGNTDLWDDMLANIAADIGIEKVQLNFMKQEIESQHPEDCNPYIASKLREIMIKIGSAGNLKKEDFPQLTDDEWKMMEEGDPFKTLVCHYTSYNLTQDLELLREIDCLRKLSSKIPSVITTNYDNLLEKEIFTNFEVRVFPDDYYFSDSNGYGEILKIHGTSGKPESIIITAEDYEKYRKNSNVITAMITSIMCRCPIIFIGYSISDKDIHCIIYNMVSSLKQTDLDRIKGHLIQVHVDVNLKKPTWKSNMITIDGKSINLMDLNLPNLEVLFTYLNRFEPTATPQEIRKYRDMISDIVLSADPRSKRLTVIDPDGIINSENEKCAVIFGTSNYVNSVNSLIKGLTGYEITDVLLDVLENRKGILDTAEASFITWFSNNRICSGVKYIPVFYYLLKYEKDYHLYSDNIITFIDNMVERMLKKIESMASSCQHITDESKIVDFLDGQNKSFHRYEAIAYFQSVGLIDRETSRKLLKRQYDKEKGSDEKHNISSELRTAITYLDYNKYIERYK